MAENGLMESVIGVSLDGTGYGTDGAIWGGEFLIGDYLQFQRAAHLRYVGMPGGDMAIREPWRMALAHLVDAGVCDKVMAKRISPAAMRTVRQMLEKRFNTPMTSSAGRLFDAVAALAGVRDRVSFEGQAAMELEWLADETVGEDRYPWELAATGEFPWVIDTRPLIRAVAEDAARGQTSATIARHFHATMADLIVKVCQGIRQKTKLDAVVLSGGVFMNVMFTRETTARLQREGFNVYRHSKVPPNDGGLSLGQLAIAAAARQRSK
jgi:hydrogenase maturation protein HypF